MRSQGGRLADGYAGGGSRCGCRRVLRPGDLVLVGEQHVGQQHVLKGVVAKVAMPVESVSEVVAVLAIGSEVGDGDVRAACSRACGPPVSLGGRG